ncbi:hypothetical protein BDW72DRAFT_187755 [Aspergillus terricola var. indicus]
MQVCQRVMRYGFKVWVSSGSASILVLAWFQLLSFVPRAVFRGVEGLSLNDM